MAFYIFLACLILLGILALAFLIYEFIKLRKGIVSGEYDSRLIYEAYEEKKKSKNKKHQVLRKTLDVLMDIVLVILAIFFLIGIVDKAMDLSTIPIKSVVVATGSMSYKNEENEYLVENELNDQIEVNDLIFLEKVDSLSDIKLYDIVCYRNEEDTQIVHRVVEINDTYLITQGDANSVKDDFKISLDDVVGKYTGVRIPFVGSVTFFLTSSYGMSAIGLILVLILTYTSLKSLSDKKEKERLNYLFKETQNLSHFELISLSGSFIKDNENYTFKESEINKKEKIDTPSTLITNSETKTLQKGERK